MIIYLIPVPLAENTEELILPSIKEIIKNTTYFFVENVRTARRFISALRLGVKIDELVFFELDKDTVFNQVVDYFKEIPQDASVGIMSEAGCAGIADPGSVAVAYAHQKNIRVVPLIGASSILLALTASGMNGQKFAFHGYLPIMKAEREEYIRNLEKESLKNKQTQIFMETPFRNNSLLEDLLKNLHPSTLLCVAADLTAPTEFIKTQKIRDWRKQTIDLHKRPAIFLIEAKNLS